MKKLNRMLLRELWKNKGQFLAASAVVFAGIAMFSATFMAYLNLKNSLDFYYSQYRFLDYYAEVAGVSKGIIHKIQAVPGVRDAMGRVVKDVSADMGRDRRVTVRLISLPDQKAPPINDLYRVSGRSLGQSGSDVCLVGQKFAEFYGLHEGDKIKTIINLRTHEFRIHGVVGSPEFIYAMKNATSFAPSAEDFGILYVKESTAQEILGFQDAYNEVHLRFARGADSKAVIERVEHILKPYGFKRGVKRKDQLSHAMVENEIKQLEEMAWMFPVIFLTVAAIIIYIMQKRLVHNQRNLIGVMKAFGYADGRILWHYLLHSLAIAVAGALPAVGVGYWMGAGMTAMYNQIFNIPVMQVHMVWDIVWLGMALSGGFCLWAGYGSAKRVLKIRPAQAMRSETPAGGRRVVLERFKAFWSRLSFGWKMSIRNLFRSPQRTIFTVLGMVFTIMFIIITMFFLDSIDYIFDQHFFVMQRQDHKVIFAKPANYQDASELASLKGVRRSEPILEVPVQIKNGWMKQETTVVGLDRRHTLTALFDASRQPTELPKQGILLAESVAEKLQIHIGDTVEIKFYLGDLKEKTVPVVGFVKQYAGFNCYMSLESLGDLLEEGPFATGALITVQRGWEKKVIRKLYEMPGIETVEGRLKAYDSFMELMEFNNYFFGMMLFFGALMGFSIIFNTTVINIMERRREMASLRVLGYSPQELERTMLRENLMMATVSVVPGLLLGRFLAGILAKQFSTDHLFAFEIVIYPKTYLISLAMVFVFTFLAQAANRKQIVGLDMVEVLKNREG